MALGLVLGCASTPPGAAAPPHPDKAYTNSLGMELAWIPNSVFVMGSPSDELDHAAAESPQTEVRISQGYWMGKYEITRGEWATLMAGDSSGSNADVRLPAENVSWFEAIECCRRLTEKEADGGRLPYGYEYRLPTEAEWELACRAGSTGSFSFADDHNYEELGNYAWFLGNSSNQVHCVGQKLPNAWGLYDMHGNVSEWCLDGPWTYHGEKLVDPLSTNSVGTRSLRGGGWNNPGKLLRSASRLTSPPEQQLPGIGFRVVLAGKLIPIGDEREQLAYAIGVIFGTGLRMDRFDVDPAIVARGLAHAYSETNSLLIPAARARALLDTYAENQHRRELKQLHSNQTVGTESTN